MSVPAISTGFDPTFPDPRFFNLRFPTPGSRSLTQVMAGMAETSDGRRMHGEYKVPGGKLVVVDLAVADRRIAQIQVSGDFFLEPDSALDAINAALRGLPADASEAALTQAVQHALADPGVSLYGITPEAVAITVRRALQAEVGA